MGLVLFILYLAQVLLGVFIHWVKIPRRWTHLLGHRPQNIIHVMLGLTILALASSAQTASRRSARPVPNEHQKAPRRQKSGVASIVSTSTLASRLPRPTREPRTALD